MTATLVIAWTALHNRLGIPCYYLGVLVAIVATGLIVVVSADGHLGRDAQAPPSGSAIVVAIPSPIEGWDPHAHTHSESQAIYANVFDLLLEQGPTGELMSGLALSWDRVNETSWRLELRPNVHWHDGSLLSAYDVAFSLERLRRDSSLGQHETFRGVASVVATDVLTVIIRTQEPDPILPLRLAKPGAFILPSAYIARVGWAKFLERPVGTGAFRLERVEAVETLVLHAFADHWRGRPEYDVLVLRVVTDANTRLLEVLSGDVDVAIGLPPQAIAVLDGQDAVTVFVLPTRRVLTLVLNTEAGVMTGDPAIRQAIELAIDKASLAEVALAGLATPARARLSQGIHMAPLEFLDGGRHDPELATELLRSSGHDGQVYALTIQLPSNLPNANDIASVIAYMLSEIGFVVQTELLEPGAFMEQVWYGGNMRSIAVRSLGNALGDAQHALRGLTCGGLYYAMTHWCRPDFDETYRRALVEMDSDARCSLLRSLFTIVSEDRPTISLLRLHEIVAVNDMVAWTPRADQSLRLYEAMPRPTPPNGARIQRIESVVVSAGGQHEQDCAADGHYE